MKTYAKKYQPRK